MTQAVLPRSWVEEFMRAAAAAKREERLRREEELALLRARTQERDEERHKKEERENDEAFEMFSKAIAPPEQVAAFRVQLDQYETRTVEALMANEEAAEIVRRRIDEMLGRAHVLPDGRRVFRTEDGQRVFDEHGTQIGSEQIDPAMISSSTPTWEAFSAMRRERDRLAEERRQLLEYQERLDRARERLDRGEITQGELDRVKTELDASMPSAVRQRLSQEQAQRPPPGETPRTELAIHARREEATPPLPDNMDDLMRRTGLSAPAGRSPAV